MLEPSARRCSLRTESTQPLVPPGDLQTDEKPKIREAVLRRFKRGPQPPGRK